MTFKLHFLDGTNRVVEAKSIVEACEIAGVQAGSYPTLEHYFVGDVESWEKRIPVSGQASCGCVYHAEDRINCTHDLERIGVREEDPDPDDPELPDLRRLFRRWDRPYRPRPFRVN